MGSCRTLQAPKRTHSTDRYRHGPISDVGSTRALAPSALVDIQVRIWVAHDSEEDGSCRPSCLGPRYSRNQIYWDEAASFTMGVPNPLYARDCTFVAWQPSILTESPLTSA